MTDRRTGKRRRRIMREFRIDEISAVDRPAQSGARAVLMKSDDAVRKRQVLTARDATGHQHALEDNEDAQSGHTSYALADGKHEAHCHPWVRHRDGTIEVGQSLGHAHAAGGAAAKSDRSTQETTTMKTAITTKDEAIRKAADLEHRLDEMAKAHATSRSIDFYKAYSEVLRSPEGRRIYAEIDEARQVLGV